VSRARLDRATISKAVAKNRSGVPRLARFVGCPADLSDAALVERLVRKLDRDSLQPSWPAPRYEKSR
jgi:hypothetical protein